MATISISSELDVLDKYECLMQESLASESIYARAKETLNEMFDNHAITSVDKASVLSNVLGSLSSSLSSAAMSVALQWASAEKDIALRKLELAKQLDILDNENALKEAQAKNAEFEGIAIQSNTIRMMGTPTVLDGRVLNLADAGRHWQDIKLGEQQEINLGKEAILLDSKLKESFAAIHKTVADTVVNHGAWTYNSLTEHGLTNAPTIVPTTPTPLSNVQRVIAQEQAKGYAYNAWANAVTGSAGMLGTAIASDGAISEINSLVSIFQQSIGKLTNVTAATF